MARNRRWRGDPLLVPAVVVDAHGNVMSGGEGGDWYCCGNPWPDHDAKCVRMQIRDGDVHLDVPENDTIEHAMSPGCPCGPQRAELYASLANPNWKGCGWKHRRVGP